MRLCGSISLRRKQPQNRLLTCPRGHRQCLIQQHVPPPSRGQKNRRVSVGQWPVQAVRQLRKPPVLVMLSRRQRAHRQVCHSLPRGTPTACRGPCSTRELAAKQCMRWSCLKMFTLAAHGRFKAELKLLPWRLCADAALSCVASATVKGLSLNDKHALLVPCYIYRSV